MLKTVTAFFDGEVLRPDSTADLEPNTRYRVTIESEPTSSQDGDAWAVLERYAGSITSAPEDWSSEHDHYLYGTPKRGQRTEE